MSEISCASDRASWQATPQMSAFSARNRDRSHPQRERVPRRDDHGRESGGKTRADSAEDDRAVLRGNREREAHALFQPAGSSGGRQHARPRRKVPDGSSSRHHRNIRREPKRHGSMSCSGRTSSAGASAAMCSSMDSGSAPSCRRREQLLNCAAWLDEARAPENPLDAVKRLVAGPRSNMSRDAWAILSQPTVMRKAWRICCMIAPSPTS